MVEEYAVCRCWRSGELLEKYGRPFGAVVPMEGYLGMLRGGSTLVPKKRAALPGYLFVPEKSLPALIAVSPRHYRIRTFGEPLRTVPPEAIELVNEVLATEWERLTRNYRTSTPVVYDFTPGELVTVAHPLFSGLTAEFESFKTGLKGRVRLTESGKYISFPLKYLKKRP